MLTLPKFTVAELLHPIQKRSYNFKNLKPLVTRGLKINYRKHRHPFDKLIQLIIEFT